MYYYVYLIQSLPYPDQRYVGITQGLNNRLDVHNSGGSVHTAKYKPWELVMYFAFKNESKARHFEKYLKSGSGRAFAQKRFWISDLSFKNDEAMLNRSM
ncbi:MAG: GIY-YIG nuclease family protein [Alphaproteobacteria bacterium]|jgi:putative endonuclease|nr:GIY-YIG nuclease family protein [Alphaproteobacteria bacterium]MBP9877367.1 GIY-YIG nuclease family protein [Alphaproteobacteria bacterium]